MSSSNKRERELARAKRERQLSRASVAKRNRSVFLPAALIALIAIVIGWNKFSAQEATPTPTHSNTPGLFCSDAPAGVSAAPSFSKAQKVDLSKDSYQWLLNTNCGQIVVELDKKNAPKTVNSMLFLTEAGYFDQTPCHRITTSGLYVLQCGDPTGTGTGGPGYEFADENLPKQKTNNYPAGTIAMAKSGPGTNGSQFFIVYDDTTLGANYTIFGHVIKGLEIVQRLAEQGSTTGTDGPPTQPIGIKTASYTVNTDYSKSPQNSPSESETPTSKG